MKNYLKSYLIIYKNELSKNYLKKNLINFFQNL